MSGSALKEFFVIPAEITAAGDVGVHGTGAHQVDDQRRHGQEGHHGVAALLSLSILFRRHAGGFPKLLSHIGAVRKTAAVADFCNGQIRTGEQFLCPAQAVTQQIFKRRLPDCFLKNSVCGSFPSKESAGQEARPPPWSRGG